MAVTCYPFQSMTCRLNPPENLPNAPREPYMHSPKPTHAQMNLGDNRKFQVISQVPA